MRDIELKLKTFCSQRAKIALGWHGTKGCRDSLLRNDHILGVALKPIIREFNPTVKYTYISSHIKRRNILPCHRLGIRIRSSKLIKSCICNDVVVVSTSNVWQIEVVRYGVIYDRTPRSTKLQLIEEGA